jgi:beta-galactosidase
MVIKKAAVKKHSVTIPRMMVSGVVSLLMLWSFADAQNSTLQVRKRVKCNYNWHFYKGNPSGNPNQTSYNDSGTGWTKVSIPHSASYDKPDEEMSFTGANYDADYYKGTSWYRKTLPAIPQEGKKFLEFEAAMQVAKVYVNGTQVGYHDNSGFTGFCFDITNQLLSDRVNAVACSLNNVASNDIPPGNNPPDYELYSGIYRDVWFVSTGDVYIPFCGQLIDPWEVSASSGKFRIKTSVTNSRSQSVQCILTSYVKDSTGTVKCTVNDTLSIPAGQTRLSTRISPVVTNPHLWSPEKPYLYQIYTEVKVDGKVTDDYIQTHGLLSFAFTVDNGFILNGSKYILKGTCHHQSMPWIQYALPKSRQFEEIRFIKKAGFNAIRCSHYPRDPDFYDACDQLGVFLIVEAPTWAGSSWPQPFWNRLYQCGKEMVLQGYNHPCIISWGAFNEPRADFSTQLRQLRDTIRTIDTLRKVYVGKQPWMTPYADCDAVDIVGLNYEYTRPKSNWICVETEYGDLVWTVRGGTTGLDNKGEISTWNARWNQWNQIISQPYMAGGFTWVFNDYTGFDGSRHDRQPHGIVDMMRVPKVSYYMYREKYLGIPNDNPVSGTSTKIDLTADVTSLDADGSDVSLISVTLRNSAGACCNELKDIQFTVTGPATLFGSNTKKTVEGRINALIKSTSTAGQISVTAKCSGLPDATVTLSSHEITDPLDPSKPFVAIASRPVTVKKQSEIVPVLRRGAHGLLIDFGHSPITKASLITIDGRTILTRNISKKSNSLQIPGISKGVYILEMTNDLGSKIEKSIVVR